MSILDTDRFAFPEDMEVTGVYIPAIDLPADHEIRLVSYPPAGTPQSITSKVLGRMSYLEASELGFENLRLEMDEDNFVPAFDFVTLTLVLESDGTPYYEWGAVGLNVKYWQTPFTITFEGL